MRSDWRSLLELGGVVTAGINGGVFFAFSTFVMPALSKLPAPQGISAMQEINRAAPNPLFMSALFGAAALGAPLAVSALGRLDQVEARYELAGLVLSVVSVVITISFHVPRNDALDGLDPNATRSAAEWTRFLSAWTRGNHVRTLSSLASAACYALALRSR